VFNTVINHNVTIYDPLYIVQAVRHELRLPISDRRRGDIASELVEAILVS